MSSTSQARELDCVIVGGGIHGTVLARRLLEETSLDRTAISIVDPHERLLASFREKTRACGMDVLRSTFVHHIGAEPFALEAFAERTGREDELVPTVDYPPRPTLELFLDHATHVIDTAELDSLHLQATVETIRAAPDGSGVRVETTAGPLEARSCVLAIGHGGRYRWPDWASTLDGVGHIWDAVDPDADVDSTIVVGGGITAGQLACTLSETQSVTLLARHPLEWEVSEAAPPWINWPHIERQLHVHPPGSSERFDTVTTARNAATIPPSLYRRLDSRLEAGTLTIVQDEIASARSTNGTVRTAVEHDREITADRVVLATGFEPVFEHPFVDRVATELELARGYWGMPILEDDTLAWQRSDGTSTPLYVSGALALGTVGPYAPNIPGARRAADRITRAIEDRTVCDRTPHLPRHVQGDGVSD